MARMGAQECPGPDTRVIFERLAALYDGMAMELERLSQCADNYSNPPAAARVNARLPEKSGDSAVSWSPSS
jgi:hypothetical protein